MAVSSSIRFAVVCASNQNRSMAAHHVLEKRGIPVSSFGTGSAVRLPGPSIDRPNVYAFGTPYEEMENDLRRQDQMLYTHNGLLHMLSRNKKIKRAPERFQDNSELFDVVITCEERCYDAVCEDLILRTRYDGKPVSVINVDIRDNHEDATIGANLILQLALQDHNLDGFETVINKFEKKHQRNFLHTHIIC